MLGQQDGAFRQDLDAEIVKQMLFGALDETSRLWHLGHEQTHTIETVSRQMTGFFLAGLCRQQS